MRAMLTIGMIAVMLTACGGGGDNSDDGQPDIVADTFGEEAIAGTDVEEDTGGVIECPGLPNLTGHAFRATSLVATEPTDKVNEVWATDIEAYTLVIVFYVLDHRPEEKVATVKVTSAWAEVEDDGAGNLTPLQYQYALEPMVFELGIDGCKLKIIDQIELDIMTPTVSKPFHVFGISGWGEITEDGKEITKLQLAGFIKESEAFDLCLEIPGLGAANFHWFMNLAHICANADSDGDGEVDSYYFKGVIKATQESDLFKPDESHPIETLVQECIPDEVACVPVD